MKHLSCVHPSDRPDSSGVVHAVSAQQHGRAAPPVAAPRDDAAPRRRRPRRRRARRRAAAGGRPGSPSRRTRPPSPAPAARLPRTRRGPRSPSRPSRPSDAPPVTEVGVAATAGVRLPRAADPRPQVRLAVADLSRPAVALHARAWPAASASSIGLSGLGLGRHRLPEVRALGPTPQRSTQTGSPTGSSRPACCPGSRPPTRSTRTGSSRARSSSSAPRIRRIARADVGGADTDDLWLRIGQWNKWDLQFGRFEGWEVFHLGMGLDQNTFERQGAFGPGDAFNLRSTA